MQQNDVRLPSDGRRVDRVVQSTSRGIKGRHQVGTVERRIAFVAYGAGFASTTTMRWSEARDSATQASAGDRLRIQTKSILRVGATAGAVGGAGAIQIG